MVITPASPTSLESAPLSPAARAYFEQIFKPGLTAMQAEVARTPLIILVWGPGPGNPALYNKRVQIRDELRRCGHAAFFSEDLQDFKPDTYSQKAIEFLQARNADFIVVMQVSYGSVAEVHDFSDDGVIARKMLIFISDKNTDGYSYQGALSELKALYNNVETFREPDDIQSCRLKTRVFEKVNVLQMVKWRAQKKQDSWGVTPAAVTENVCPKCGRSNRPGARFCAYCQLQLRFEPAGKLCAKCHSVNLPDARFCSYCGSPLEPEATP